MDVSKVNIENVFRIFKYVIFFLHYINAHLDKTFKIMMVYCFLHYLPLDGNTPPQISFKIFKFAIQGNK
jgi:hypothetical protein